MQILWEQIFKSKSEFFRWLWLRTVFQHAVFYRIFGKSFCHWPLWSTISRGNPPDCGWLTWEGEHADRWRGCEEVSGAREFSGWYLEKVLSGMRILLRGSDRYWLFTDPSANLYYSIQLLRVVLPRHQALICWILQKERNCSKVKMNIEALKNQLKEKGFSLLANLLIQSSRF